MTMWPKPPPRAKAPRKPMRRSGRIGPRKVAGPRPSDILAHPKPRREKKTKHGRRSRELGFMGFCKARGCELNLDKDTQVLLGIRHRCKGPVQFAHLSDLKRYDVGDVGAGLCAEAGHQGFDGRIGGKMPEYATLERVSQRTIRMRLANRARRAWDGLTPDERSGWDARAAAELGLAAALPR